MGINKVAKELSQNEKKVLLTLKKLKGKGSPEDISEEGNFKQIVEVMNASSWLQSKKLVSIREHIKTVYSLGKEGKKFVTKGFPERRALKLLSKHDGKIYLGQLSKNTNLEKKDVPIAIGWLKRKGWADIKKDSKGTFLKITEKGKKLLKTEDEDEKIIHFLSKNPNNEMDEKKLKWLKSRKDIIKEKSTVICNIELTDKGREIIRNGVETTAEISQITSGFITSGDWKRIKIRPYNIDAFAPSVFGGKQHPVQYLIRKIRQIFLEIGFEEIEGDYVESCFWNMDILFIPQDHPARDMQDTLYCKNPSEVKIEERDLVDKIAKVHEDGGITSSKGWRYKFSKIEGERALLRTHTTVNTIRYLYNNPKPPCKVFSIGKVFRKENIDTTHLPEFYQVEGIIHEKGTNFRQLIGVLKEFYGKMGFEKIRFRPAYFPYTEPSMEVEVFWNNEWMELGGSGIFRPEVTEPIGVTEPVLAWGLGLERLAMLKFELHDIRKLYISDLDWLRKTPLI